MPPQATLESIQADLEKYKKKFQQIKTEVEKLPQINGDPVSAESLTSTAIVPVVAEQTPVEIEDISDQKAQIESAAAAAKAEIDALKAAEEKALGFERPEVQMAKFFERLGEQKTEEEVRAALIAERAPETAREVAAMSEIQSLMTQYNQKEQAKEAMLAAARQTVGSEAFIGRQLSKKERAANVELNNLASQINLKMSFNEMERGQFDRAEKHLRLGLDAYNSERRAELQDFRTFFTLNKSIFDDIDDKYKTIFTDIVELKEAEIKENDKRIDENYNIFVKELVRNPGFVVPDNWQEMPTADAQKAVITSPGWVEQADEEVESDFWSAINKGVNELQQGEMPDNVWSRIKQQFPNIEDEVIDSALRISWKEPGAFQKFREQKGKNGNGFDFDSF